MGRVETKQSEVRGGEVRHNPNGADDPDFPTPLGFAESALPMKGREEEHQSGGGGAASTSLFPAWLAMPTTPSFSIRSISEAARL